MSCKYIFGPVASRRLGSSLGINMIPSKICSFDCLYCEVGKTTLLTSEQSYFFDTDKIVTEFKQEYAKLKSSVDVITFTGSGEPTLNKNLFPTAIEIKNIAKHPLVLLTNSSTISDSHIQSQLMVFDIIIASIDAATQSVFEKINLPETSLKIAEINNSLIKFSHKFKGKLFLEILLVKDINDTLEELDAISDIVRDCNYDSVQLNTVFRPPAYENTQALSLSELIDVYLYLKDKGIKVEPTANFISKTTDRPRDNLNERILSLLKMRPCTISDLVTIFDISVTEASVITDFLVSEKLIRPTEHSGNIFYFGN